MGEMCVFPMPVALSTCSSNWALYTPTCHSGSYCCWYYGPLSSCQFLCGHRGSDLAPAGLSHWHWSCLLGPTRDSLLTVSTSRQHQTAAVLTWRWPKHELLFKEICTLRHGPCKAKAQGFHAKLVLFSHDVFFSCYIWCWDLQYYNREYSQLNYFQVFMVISWGFY